MLERFWLKAEVENHPLYCFLFSFLFTIISILIAESVVPFRVGGISYSGIISVLMVSLAASYPLVRYLEKRVEEEEKLAPKLSEEVCLIRHSRETVTYLSFFFGVTFGFAFMYYYLPPDFFSTQLSTIAGIMATGKFIDTSLLSLIITNNLWVFLITFTVSFLISAGMVFILVWNASVFGVFLARVSESIIHASFLSLNYMFHGIPEISAYILAGLSGFLLSRQMEEYLTGDYKYGVKTFIKLTKDSLSLFVIGLVLIFVAGFLEVL